MSEINKNIISNLENKIKLGSLNKSLNSSLDILKPHNRKDKFGNSISKILKKHKVSFADQVENSREFVEIKVVSSYRVYYKKQIEEDKFGCLIF
jgi:hypothetical protein